MWLGLHSKFCKGSVGRIFISYFNFFISNILIFCKIAAQGGSPHPRLPENKKESEVNNAKQYLLNGNIHNFDKIPSRKYHIQCGYFWSLKKKESKRDHCFWKKGSKWDQFLSKKGPICTIKVQGSCLNEENIIEPISSFVFRRYLYRITPAHNDQFLQIYLARIFPYKTQNPKQCIVSPRPIKPEKKKRYCVAL